MAAASTAATATAAVSLTTAAESLLYGAEELKIKLLLSLLLYTIAPPPLAFSISFLRAKMFFSNVVFSPHILR